MLRRGARPDAACGHCAGQPLAVAAVGHRGPRRRRRRGAHLVPRHQQSELPRGRSTPSLEREDTGDRRLPAARCSHCRRRRGRRCGRHRRRRSSRRSRSSFDDVKRRCHQPRAHPPTCSTSCVPVVLEGHWVQGRGADRGDFTFRGWRQRRLVVRRRSHPGQARQRLHRGPPRRGRGTRADALRVRDRRSASSRGRERDSPRRDPGERRRSATRHRHLLGPRSRMLLVGIATNRPELLRDRGPLRLGGRGRHGARHRRDAAGPHHPRLRGAVRGRARIQPKTPPLFNVATMWSALEGSILLWGLVLAGLPGHRGPQVPRPAHRPAGGVGRWSCSSRVTVVLHAVDGGPGQPLRPLRRPGRLRRARARTRCSRTTSWWRSTRRCSTSATSGSPCRSRSPWLPWSRAAWARGGSRDPALDAVRLGLPHGRHRARVPGGPTTCSAGVATGAGTRWRTHRSCRG